MFMLVMFSLHPLENRVACLSASIGKNICLQKWKVSDSIPFLSIKTYIYTLAQTCFGIETK